MSKPKKLSKKLGLRTFDELKDERAELKLAEAARKSAMVEKFVNLWGGKNMTAPRIKLALVRYRILDESDIKLITEAVRKIPDVPKVVPAEVTKYNARRKKVLKADGIRKVDKTVAKKLRLDKKEVKEKWMKDRRDKMKAAKAAHMATDKWKKANPKMAAMAKKASASR